MRVIAIIPARKGSKGVPGKNKKVIAGRPLISYTLEAAFNSKYLSDIYVSSDDDEILEIANEFGARLHKRPSELASDESPIGKTVREILNLVTSPVDAVLLLQPTSPLRTSQDIDAAIDLLEKHGDAQSVISVVPMNDVHPARMYRIDGRSYLESFFPEYEHARRQDIPDAYYRNGCIYVTRVSAFEKQYSMINHPVHPYVMDAEWLLNIDSPRDVLIAEALIPVWLKQKCS